MSWKQLAWVMLLAWSCSGGGGASSHDTTVEADAGSDSLYEEVLTAQDSRVAPEVEADAPGDAVETDTAPEALAPLPGFERYCLEQPWQETLQPAAPGKLSGDYQGLLNELPAWAQETMKVIPEHPMHVKTVRIALAGSGPVALHLMHTFGRSYPANYPEIDEPSANLMEPLYFTVQDANPEEWIELDVSDRGVYLEPTNHYMLVYRHMATEPFLAVESLTGDEAWARSMLHIPGDFEPYGIDGNYRMEITGDYFCAWAPEDFWMAEVEDAPFAVDGAQRPAFGDVNGDGHDDLVTQLSGLRVYLGDGDGGFLQGGSFPDELKPAFSILGDVDNDGDRDIFAPAWAVPTEGEADPVTLNRILLNDGDGNFEILADSGVETVDVTGAAAFGDGDGDGLLDVYWGNWLFQYPEPEAMSDRYAVGVGGGAFADATEEAGLVLDFNLPCYGVSWADYDNDGRQDIWVGNYRLSPNLLWRNLDGVSFQNVAAEAGIDHDHVGAWAGHSYGGDWGDVDNDGDLDLFVPNLAHPRTMPDSDPSKLYINQGGPDWTFIDVAADHGIIYDEGDVNAAFGDYDNDGDLDLALATLYKGHFSKLYRNDGDAGFTDVTYETGTAVHDAVAVLWSDVDEDGDLDLLIADRHGAQRLQLFRNRVGQDRNWIQLVLEGKTCNRDAIGARVTLRAGDLTMIREVKGGGRHTGAQDSLVVHFGLGDLDVVDQVTVQWPGAGTEEFPGLVAGIRYKLVEGEGE